MQVLATAGADLNIATKVRDGARVGGCESGGAWRQRERKRERQTDRERACTCARDGELVVSGVGA